PDRAIEPLRVRAAGEQARERRPGPPRPPGGLRHELDVHARRKLAAPVRALGIAQREGAHAEPRGEGRERVAVPDRQPVARGRRRARKELVDERLRHRAFRLDKAARYRSLRARPRSPGVKSAAAYRPAAPASSAAAARLASAPP